MSALQHFGWFFSRGFGPQGWGHDRWGWGYDWRRPDLYQQAVRTLEQAAFELVIMEDAISMGNPSTLDVRARSAYGAPKHDPLMLAPYLLAATERIGITPTINAGITPPYLAARQIATLQHLSAGRFGVNVVTDVGSARHVGAEPVAHDVAYDRASEWTSVVRRLWRSWGEGALVADAASGRFADTRHIDAFEHRGEHFTLDGPLNAVPFDGDEPVIVSPGGSPRGLAYAGEHSDVQLALAPLDLSTIADYRARVHSATTDAGRQHDDIRILFVIKPEIVQSESEVDRVVRASETPDDAAIRAVLEGQSSDLETDLTVLDLDVPFDRDMFAGHVSQGTIRGLLAGSDEGDTLRQIATRKAKKGSIADGTGLVGTAAQFADYFEDAGSRGNDGFILSGDLHPVTVQGMLAELVPELRRRGILRTALSSGGTKANLSDF